LEQLESRVLLNAGALDPTFGTNGEVTTQLSGGFAGVGVALQSDGKIVEAGTTQLSGMGGNSFALVRYTTSGALDTTFGNNGVVLGSAGEDITGIAVEPDGTIVATGFTSQAAVVYAFNSNGSPDSSFGTNGIATVDAASGARAAGIALQPNGQILGLFGIQSGSSASAFRLNANGTVDSSFTSPSLPINANGTVTVAPDGRIIIGGTADVFRLNSNGSFDSSFASGGTLSFPPSTHFDTLAVQADGRVIVASSVFEIPGPPGGFPQVNRFTRNGNRDFTFNEGSSAAQTVIVQPDDSILVVGAYPQLNVSVERLIPNGNLDPPYGNNGTALLDFASNAAAALQPDGKLVVLAGNTTARLLGDTPSGTADQQFVSQVYLDLLQRPADSTGLAQWSGLLQNGQATREQVVGAIEHSPEFEHLVVNRIYQEYLKRSPSPAGLASWTNFLANGGTIDQLRAKVLGSPEFFGDSGNTNASFVSALYLDVLGRPADSGGAAFWEKALANGMSRTSVASNIISSQEGSSDEMDWVYYWLLHRAPDPAGLEGFSHDLQMGVSTQAIIAAIMASPEYAMTRVG
jgi:uncharacterized delta-60 repeat protein